MFTGIVQGKAQVKKIEKLPLLHQIQFTFPKNALNKIQVGASIAINGVCLTVIAFSLPEDNKDEPLPTATFDIMIETLNKTAIINLKQDDWVNFERAAKIGDEIGGHLVSGHIHGTCQLIKIQRPPNNTQLTFKVPEQWGAYFFEKGFIGLNGCSLTLSDVSDKSFSVFLIPETLSTTTFGSLSVGDKVNFEIDSQTQTIVDTIHAMKHIKILPTI